MDKITDKNCCGCGACANACPKQCISMRQNQFGFFTPSIGPDCIDCGLCVKICPNNREQISTIPKCYAVKNPNREIVKKSSSGGVFSIIANYVIEKSGVVYGASFDSPRTVIHIRVDNKDELYRLRGSKYVQSNTGNTMRQAKNDLENGKIVLYTGTPCQIAGLKRFLRKDYSNLICVGIVCHGTPSPMVYNKYLDFLEGENHDKLEEVNFRDKRKGWTNYCLSFKFNKGQEVISLGRENPYIRGFVNNLYVMDACAECKFKLESTLADFTIGDLWGADAILGIDYDRTNDGVSFFSINSDHGYRIFEDLVVKSDFSEISIEDASKYNPSIIKSPGPNTHRDEFFEQIDCLQFPDLINKYLGSVKKVSVYARVKSMIYTIYARICRFK